MANVFATKNGNWNDPTVWNTGALPATTDDVYANGYTIAINQNITVLSIRTTVASGIVAPAGVGGFTVGQLVTIVGDVISGFSICLTQLVSCSINIVGNVYGGTGIFCRGIHWQLGGTLNITGNVYGGSVNTSPGINNQSAGIINVTGNVYGGSSVGCEGIYNQSGGIVTVTGNCFGTSIYGITNNSTGVVNIIGIAYAGNNYAVYNIGAGTVNVTAAIAGTGTAASVPAVYNASILGKAIVKNITFGSAGQVPIGGFVKFSNSTDTTISVVQDNNSVVILQNYNNLTNVIPAITNVRSGVSYNSGNSVGTLIVPNVSDVRKGISVDNTVGTADLTAADIWNYATRKLTNLTDAQVDAIAKEYTLNLVKTKVDGLNNTDLTTLAKEATLSLVKTKVDSLNNTDLTTLAKEATLNLVKTKVDGLNNTDLTTLAKEATLDLVKTSIENIEVDNVAISTQIWKNMPERLKNVSTVESVVAQLVGIL